MAAKIYLLQNLTAVSSREWVTNVLLLQDQFPMRQPIYFVGFSSTNNVTDDMAVLPGVPILQPLFHSQNDLTLG